MTHTKNKILKPILFTCLGYFCYNLYDAGAKDLLGNLHFSQVLATVGVIMTVLMAVCGGIFEGRRAFRTARPGGMALHAVIYVLINIGNMLAFPHVQLTTFYTLMFTSPFTLALLSSFFLGDKLDRQRLAVILFGFCVILYIFRPGAGLLNIWSLLLLGTATLYSCRMVLVRHLGAGESSYFMIITCALACAVTGALFLGGNYVPLSLSQWVLLLGMCAVNCAGLLLINYAFQGVSSASIVAPYHYTQIVWGAALGYLIFGDVPTAETMVGAVLLVLSGIYMLHQETRRTIPQTETTA